SGDHSTLVLGAYLTLSVQGNANLDYKHIDTSSVSITVGSVGVDVQSVNVYVVKGQNLDPSTWKLVKNVPFTSQGTVLTVTGGEMAQALGIDPDSINTDLSLYPEAVTKDGRKFSIANTPTTFESFPAYNMAFIWPVTLINYVCPYDQSFFNGSFAVISDQWQDYTSGDLVTVTPGPGVNQITLALYPKPGVGSNRKNIVANVDPTTDSLSVPSQIFGDYGGDVNFSCTGVGVLSACSGVISLTLDISSPADGDFGLFTIVLTKQ
ncbi:MAG: hypothetical protein JST96_10995, partial [Bacteroidetes bacterium]|nr:hypothetical protein [Bacteroidota bacterium]